MMRGSTTLLFLMALTGRVATSAPAAEQAVFSTVKYDV